MADNDLEIYKERYATWRHLDGVRWQIVQMLIALISAGAAIAALDVVSVGWPFWMLAGAAFLAIAVVQHRVSAGIHANNRVLAEFGRRIGDAAIPEARARDSAVHWLTIAIGVLGLGMLAAGLVDLIDRPAAAPAPGAVR